MTNHVDVKETGSTGLEEHPYSKHLDRSFGEQLAAPLPDPSWPEWRAPAQGCNTVRAPSAQEAAEALVKLHCLQPGLPFDVQKLDDNDVVGAWRFVALQNGGAEAAEAIRVGVQFPAPLSVEALKREPHLLRGCSLFLEALEATRPGAAWRDDEVLAVAATLEWALGLNESGRLALARELGGLRARQEAKAEGAPGA